jgi:hypothetical protein
VLPFGNSLSMGRDHGAVCMDESHSGTTIMTLGSSYSQNHSETKVQWVLGFLDRDLQPRHSWTSEVPLQRLQGQRLLHSWAAQI